MTYQPDNDSLTMNIHVPANLDVSGASLPQTYENAKTALAECASIDECKDWSDKASALASYARMSEKAM